jgi:hypothetical protein
LSSMLSAVEGRVFESYVSAPPAVASMVLSCSLLYHPGA